MSKGLIKSTYFNIYDACGLAGCIKFIPACDIELINLLKVKGFNEVERVEQHDDRRIFLYSTNGLVTAYIDLTGGVEVNG